MLDRFTWFKQSSYLWRGPDHSVYIDPWGLTVDYLADVVLVTHAHFDHYSPEDIERVAGPDTVFVAPYDVAAELAGHVTPVRPGDVVHPGGLRVEAVPAYNVVEGRLDHHPRAKQWVGYVIELGKRTYFHAGDTDHVPELDAVRADVAFLPVGGTVTMDAAEAGGLARAIAPELAVPMHYAWNFGVRNDAEDFRRAAAPVRVREMLPQHQFELY